MVATFDVLAPLGKPQAYEVPVEIMAGGTRTIKHFYSPGMSLPERTLTGMVAEVDEMLSSVREGRPPSVGGAEGRAALAAVLAVYESSATGQWITVT